MTAIQVGLWFLAGLISLYFSIGSARIWTSISTGFFLVFLSEGYLLAPWVEDPRLKGIHLIVGTIAIMVMTYGFWSTTSSAAPWRPAARKSTST